MEDLIGVALRISFSYLFILTLLRLSGKRSIRGLSPLDFLVALILGDLFDDVFWGEVAVAQAVVAMTSIILLHTLMAAVEAHSQPLHRLVTGKAVQVVDHAEVCEEGLRKERTNVVELWSMARLKGTDDLNEIREAYWETSGQLSVLPTEAADVARKQDLPQVKKRVRR